MATCGNCYASVDDAAFCPRCGSPIPRDRPHSEPTAQYAGPRGGPPQPRDPRSPEQPWPPRTHQSTQSPPGQVSPARASEAVGPRRRIGGYEYVWRSGDRGSGWYNDDNRWFLSDEDANQRQQGATAYAPPPAPLSSAQANQWAMWAHILNLVTFIGPLIILLTKGKDSAFVEDQAKEALNFSITVIAAAFACGILAVIYIGALLLPLVIIAYIVFSIVAAISASKGVKYRYPVAIRLIK